MSKNQNSEPLHEEKTDINPQELKTDLEETSKQNDETNASSRLHQSPKFLRVGLLSIAFIVMVFVAWGVGTMIVNGTSAPPQPTQQATKTPVTLPSTVSTPVFSTAGQAGGVYRLPELQVTNSSVVEKRNEVINYTVQAGDTIFGIGEKFGLKPETVLWANRYTLGDTPDGLGIGVELVILPEDGVYHRWSEGEGLNGVSSFYGVDPDVIVNYPLNSLNPATVGDYANPNIEPGTMLIVPGGTRPSVVWIAARDNPVSGNSYLGPGACGGIIYGNVGTGTFTWPTSATWLSGYDYNPPVHNGLDFGGDFGSPIYASDSGVIVYSGWSDRGYGNLIVIDHDGGWQTFYAHMMDGTLLPCGTNVQKGQLIASMGSTGRSTGPHLHFELRLNGNPVNPWQFLQ
ncbi:MAG: peptidoglycan DD-metalloendopeptidase family protein [Anaerolineales bacterium]